MSTVNRMVAVTVKSLERWLIRGMDPVRLIAPALAKAVNEVVGTPEVLESGDPLHPLNRLREVYVWAGPDPEARRSAFDAWVTGLRVSGDDLAHKPAGWAQPTRTKKLHWFGQAEMKSACGKWVHLGDRESDELAGVLQSPDQCSQCFGQLQLMLIERTVGKQRKVRKDKGIPRGPKKVVGGPSV